MEETSPTAGEEFAASPFGPSAIRKDEAVALDRDALKLLASDTRLDILKALRTRRMTVSELSSTLALGKSTVFEHVNKLVEGNLVVRHDDPRREWVYYELAPKAKRLFSPVSAKIVLMLSSVVGLALAALLGFALFGTAGAGLHVDVDAPEPLLAGEPTLVDVRVQTSGGDAVGDAELTLARSDAYAAFRDGGPLDGRDLVASEGRVRLALPAGDYHVVAETPDGALASRDGSGHVRVTSATLHADPALLLLGADDGRPVRLWLTHGARVLDEGTLLVEGDAARPEGSRAIRFDDPIETVRLDLAAPGDVAFSWRPAGSQAFYAAVEGTIPVAVPSVAVAPDYLYEDQPATLTVTVWHEARGAVPEAEVRVEVEGGRVARGETDARGVARLEVLPTEPGLVRVYIGDVLFETVPVVRTMVAQTAVTSLGLELWAQDLETGRPIVNAPVELDGVQVAQTDASGHALVQEQGAVVVRAPGYAPYGVSVPGYEAEAVHWVSASERAPRSELRAPAVAVTEIDVSASPARVPLGGVVHLTAVFSNTGMRPVVETAVLRVDGARWSTQDVPLAPGETRAIEFPVVLREPGIHRLGVNEERVLEVLVEAPPVAVEAVAREAPLPWALGALAAAGAALLLRRR